jgi:antitoxin component of MazEF toxin-antitoxin module
MTIETRTKKWGNSIGIVIPKDTIENLNIKSGEDIVVDIQKKENVLKEMFGKAKIKKSAEKMIKEVRKDLESKWM